MACRLLVLTCVVLLLVYPDLMLVPRQGQSSGVVVEAATQAQVYSLMDKLFNGYRPEVRPSDAGEGTFVFVSLYLLSLQGLDERSQVLESAIIVEAQWVDDWLAWNSSEYGNITDFLYPQSKIWLPDLVIENSVESQRQLGYNMNLVRIESTGLIDWSPSEVIKTGCDIDVTYYPFDTQTCSIIVSTWMSTKKDIDIDPQAGHDGLILDKYGASGTWELMSNSVVNLQNENGLTRIQFKMKLKRLRAYYILNIILPVLFLSFTASMVFFLPSDAGEKIGMGITVLLAYAVYLTIIADNMPQTSLQVSYLAVYLTLLLGLTALGVVLAVVVLHIHHKSDDCQISQRTETITRKLRRLLRLNKQKPGGNKNIPPLDTKQKSLIGCSRPRSKVAVTPVLAAERSMSPPPSYSHDKHEDEEEITWFKVAETLDRFLFILLSFTIAVITLVFLLILAAGPS
ncbi:acetylcholine receptor subunit alpha [Elysia marginata]|uniref:Acetylcholine receptor subunit alpha n=1 Tax=Elysia marginata TaxID=1093978 RepID=A0AAV4E9I4_9GAST|nr:acetylcholine receptor subunit alpha [Elysia marginata]